MKISRVLIIGFFLSMVGLGLASHASEDDRELVKLPPMMQEHMLANMRDHLAAIEEILGELASGNVDEASAIAENRLGMSSLSLHGAKHLGKFMPEAMGAIGTQMHHAASRFSIVAQDAELNAGKTPQREVYKALQEITGNCNACHRAYRIR
jgi:cytochrome c556